MCGHSTNWQIVLNLIINVPKVYLKFLNRIIAMPARMEGGKVT